MNQCIDFVLSSFSQILKLPENEIQRVCDDIPMPIFERSIISQLLHQAIIKYKKNPNPVVHISGDHTIVGNLHGHFHDLIRSLKSNPENKFIFLGDFVDRGEYSLEVLVLLLALNIKYPEKIFYYEAIMSSGRSTRCKASKVML